MEIKASLSLQEKLHILADAAKYDVACTSSGADRRGRAGYLGNSVASGVCHSFAADGRCISLLKILLTNHCIHDCKYCINRTSNDIVRTAFTPEEICTLTIEFYKRNYIEGLFLSSAVMRSPAYTMEQICRTLFLLRTKYRFNGYIHVKAIPGAPDDLLAEAGYLADRMSINLELPTTGSLKLLAPGKSPRSILRPMRQITDTIALHRVAIGKSARMERSSSTNRLSGSIFSDGAHARVSSPSDSRPGILADGSACSGPGSPEPAARSALALPAYLRRQDLQRPFAPAGQSTQMIIGATPETDYDLLRTAQYLYQAYDLKRVFFSAYVPLNEDHALPAPGTPVPLLREHRLYQADWLLRFYGFHADELLSGQQPNFNELLDPKCDWALRHLDQFPVEISAAPFDMLLRIPGIGPKSAARIVQARRHSALDFCSLKKMGVVLKRAHYFITCSGKTMYRIPFEKSYITRQLIGSDGKGNWQISHPEDCRQMSLFNDFGLSSAYG